jgi:hypothetical protein
MGMEVKVDPMNIVFARIMEVITYVGLAVMIATGVAYMGGVSPFVEPSKAISNWDKPAVVFWEETKGITIHGYSWFLNNLSFMDCISVLGVAIMSLAPLFSIIGCITRADSKYKLLLAVVVVEFVVSIVRPLVMHVTGL